jgi:OmpA-OmpF porin, OOP family
MSPRGKLLTGLTAVAALATATHFLGAGQATVNMLQTKAQSALDAEGLDAAQVSFDGSPLKRVAVLSGALPSASREKALNAVRAVSGVMDVRWDEKQAVGGTPATPVAEANPAPELQKPATGNIPAKETTDNPAPATNSLCQQRVDTAIKGRSITFRNGSPWVNFPARKLIADVAAAFKSCSDATLVVTGHADGSGGQSINRAMSQARADAVRALLLADGLSASHVTAKGMGAGHPVAGADVSTNRRIEFHVSGGAPAPTTGKGG